ncbi:hypothetical protein IAU59_002254 [Kwoniella sp. CBS 9459]
MPKVAAEDHRPARAVLHAPYPLPFIVTRQPVPPLRHAHLFPPAPASVPPRETARSPVPIPQVSASVTDFPTFQNDWRAMSPAIPPIPYPAASKEEGREERIERIKKLRLLKWQKGKQDDSSEYELMSLLGIGAEGTTFGSNLLDLTKQVGNISAGEGGQDDQDSNLDENNLLIYAFVSSFDRGSFDSPPSDRSPKTPTGPALPHPAPAIRKVQADDNDNQSAYRSDTPIPSDFDVDGHGPFDEDTEDEQDREDTPKPGPPSVKKHFETLKPKTPAWDIVSDAMSSFWSDGTNADQADEEGNTGVSPASQSLITPSASASRLAKHLKNPTQRQDKSHSGPHSARKVQPLFLGQTNQAPFTYVPRPRAPPSQSSIGDGGGDRIREGMGGYLSEAGSVRTVRQIVRSKVNRLRVKRERQRERDKHQESDRSLTPMQRDYQPLQLRSNHVQSTTPTQPHLDPATHGSAHVPQSALQSGMTGAAVESSVPQPSMFGLDAFAFAPFAPLLRPSEVFSSPPTSGLGHQPPQHTQSHNQAVPPLREPSYSPQPMSIDPRTTETQLWGNTSWPHALPAREQVVPSNAMNLLRRLDEGVDVPMPTAESRLSQPRIRRPDIGRSGNQGPAYSRARGKGIQRGDEYDEDVVPLGKACHNAFLLRHRAGTRKRESTLAGLNGRLGKARNPRLRALVEDARGHLHQGGSGPALATITGQNGLNHPSTTTSTFPPQQTGNLPQVQAQAQAPWFGQLQSMIQQMAQSVQPQQQQMMGPPQINWSTQASSSLPAANQMQNWAQAIPILQALGLVLPGTQAQQQQQQPSQQVQQMQAVQQQTSGAPLNTQSQPQPSTTNQNTWFPPTPAPAPTPDQGSSPFRHLQPQTRQQRQASQPPWSTQPFSFPTPGPTPYVPGPAYEEQKGHGDMKPPRKRRRSISPTSAHDMIRETRSPSARPGPALGLPFLLGRAGQDDTHLRPPAHQVGIGRATGFQAQTRNHGYSHGLLGSPAVIINKRSPIYRAQTPRARHDLGQATHQAALPDTSEEESMYDQAKLDIGINVGVGVNIGSSRPHTRTQLQTPAQKRTLIQEHNRDRDGDVDVSLEGGETEVERVGRRDKWVHAQRRINARGGAAKGKGRAV